jgi:ankyrin repeat protein
MFSCKYGERPTSEAALAIVDALLAHGADPNALDAQGNPVLIRAAGACDGEVYRRLIAAGADAGAKNPMGMTAFAMALTLGDVEVAEVLVGAGFRLAPEEAATMRQWFPEDAEKQRLIALAAR